MRQESAFIFRGRSTDKTYRIQNICITIYVCKQTHTCTKTCRKKGPECRFGFPRLPSNKILITDPVARDNKVAFEELKESKETLKKMRAFLDRDQFKEDQSFTDI